MNKIFKFMLAFAAAAFLFAACDKPEPEPTPTPDPGQTEVCEECGKNPCECEKEPNEEPNEEPTPTPAAWADHVFVVEWTIDTNAGYGYDEFDMSALTDENGKHVYELLGYESWDELGAAIGNMEQSFAGEGLVAVNGYNFGTESTYDGHNVGGAWGNWCNATGYACGWGALLDPSADKSETNPCVARMYNKIYENEAGTMNNMCEIGFMPGELIEGEEYRIAIVFTNEDKLTVGIETKAKVEAFVDPEAALYEGKANVAGTFEIPVTATLSVAEGSTFADISKIQEYLQLSKHQIATTVNQCQYDDFGELFAGLEKVFVDANGNVASGCWVNGSQEVVAWQAEDAVMYFDNYFDFEYCEAAFGIEGLNKETAVASAIGQTFNFTHRFTYLPEDAMGDPAKMTVINVNYAVTLAE